MKFVFFGFKYRTRRTGSTGRRVEEQVLGAEVLLDGITVIRVEAVMVLREQVDEGNNIIQKLGAVMA